VPAVVAQDEAQDVGGIIMVQVAAVELVHGGVVDDRETHHGGAKG
jgi:hypothetical protein